MKYRFKRPDGTPVDETVEDTWRRVARTLAEVEAPGERARWEESFFRGHGRLPLPARRADPGRRRHRAKCYIVQLLRHGHARRLDARHL
jgi:ribonucleoside-diphosphate reductase alpha chain